MEILENVCLCTYRWISVGYKPRSALVMFTAFRYGQTDFQVVVEFIFLTICVIAKPSCSVEAAGA